VYTRGRASQGAGEAVPDIFGYESWNAFYEADVQAVWALLPVPFLFVLWRLVRLTPPARTAADPEAAGFVERYAVAFGILTVLDPICTGPLVRSLGAGESVGTVVMLLFVLLGDWRVFVLLERLWGEDTRLAAVAQRAALWTCLVPLLAWPLHQLLRLVDPELPGQALWLVYESLFVGLALALRARVGRRAALEDKPAVRAFLRLVLSYVAIYYGLWALSDALILAADLDAGWAVRMVPNQLYYAFYVPFVWLAFFSPRRTGTTLDVRAAPEA